MKGKNKDKDRWYSSIRSPYERVFSQQNKRTRYRGIAKNQFAAFMEAICFNLKRLAVLGPPGVIFTQGEVCLKFRKWIKNRQKAVKTLKNIGSNGNNLIPDIFLKINF